jgi:Flp pilus assembly protein TadG
MTNTARTEDRWHRLGSRIWDNGGSQIVEFAVSLPLLMVLLVGFYDFGSAFSVKYKVINAARDGARFATTQPMADLSQGAAAQSVWDVGVLVGNTLLASGLPDQDCGLATNAGSGTNLSYSPLTLTWTWTAACAGGGFLTLKVQRGGPVDFTAAPSVLTPNQNVTVQATAVTLTYPYKWRFNSVIQLVAPGANYAATTQLTATTIMQNLN